MKNRTIISLFFLYAVMSGDAAYPANPLTDIDAIRSDIIKQGSSLPSAIKNVKSIYDIRTLERIFESNSSILTAIESYFRMVKIVSVSDKQLNTETVKALNDWLVFIGKQCAYHKEFLDTTIPDIKDPEVILQLKVASQNTGKLISALKSAAEENTSFLKNITKEKK